MITNPAISVKWATAINQFDIKKSEDLETFSTFRSWFMKASTIEEVPQPYRGWVENGLPPKHKRD